MKSTPTFSFFSLGIAVAAAYLISSCKPSSVAESNFPKIDTSLSVSSIDSIFWEIQSARISSKVASKLTKAEFALLSDSRPIPASIGRKELDEFTAAMATPILETGTVIGELFRDSDLYDGSPDPFCNEMDLSKLPKDEYLIIYPVVRKLGDPIEFMFTTADVNKNISSDIFDHEGNIIDKNVFEGYKQNLKEITTWYNGFVMDCIFSKGFYKPQRKYFSIYVTMTNLNNWIAKHPGIASLRFYAGQKVGIDPAIRQFTILVAGYNGNQMVTTGDEAYFNVTYPCPPPIDCK